MTPDAAHRSGLGSQGARILGLVDGDEPAVRARRIAAFEQGFALVVAAEYWLRAVPKWDQLQPHYFVLLAIATVAGVAIVLRRARRTAFVALAAAHLVLLWAEFPSSGNHAYLELELCLVAALLRPDDEQEGLLYLRAVRWIAVIVLFYSGVQKLAHGSWLHAEYLVFSLGSETYRALLGWLLPPDELARVIAYRGEVGDGPYRVAGWTFPLLSNGTWIAEIVLAIALCVRRVRPVAMVGALSLLLAIEVVAREVFFGLVFASAILLFTRGDTQGSMRWAIVAVLLALIGSRAGVLPAVTFY